MNLLVTGGADFLSKYLYIWFLFSKSDFQRGQLQPGLTHDALDRGTLDHYANPASDLLRCSLSLRYLKTDRKDRTVWPQR